jgi:hypothetical protein
MGWQIVRQSGRVFGRLRLHAGERAFGLRFDRARRSAVEIEQVVGKAEARLHRKFAHSDPAPGRKVKVIPILDDPPGRR